jgi:hypothetical protein
MADPYDESKIEHTFEYEPAVAATTKSKLRINMFEMLDVFPVAKRFVVVIAFEAWMFPVTSRVVTPAVPPKVCVDPATVFEPAIPP